MKEVPQKTAYVVIDPAWGEPEIILETVSASREEAQRKALVHPNYALWSGAALHVTPPVPGDWDQLEAQGFMVQEMVCGIVPDSVPVFDPTILNDFKSEEDITKILQENAAIMGQPVREVITQLHYERDRNQASRQYHISKVKQLSGENKRLRKLDVEYGQVEAAIIMADKDFDGDSKHAGCGERLVASVHAMKGRADAAEKTLSEVEAILRAHLSDECSAQGAEVLKAKLAALGLNMEAEHA